MREAPVPLVQSETTTTTLLLERSTHQIMVKLVLFPSFISRARHNDHLLMDVLSALMTKRPNFEVNDMNNAFLRGPYNKFLDTTLVKRGFLWYCSRVFLEIFTYVFLRHKNKNVFKQCFV